MDSAELIEALQKENADLKRQLEGRQNTEILQQQIKYLESVQEIFLKEMRESEFDYSASITEISKLIFLMVKMIQSGE